MILVRLSRGFRLSVGYRFCIVAPSEAPRFCPDMGPAQPATEASRSATIIRRIIVRFISTPLSELACWIRVAFTTNTGEFHSAGRPIASRIARAGTSIWSSTIESVAHPAYPIWPKPGRFRCLGNLRRGDVYECAGRHLFHAADIPFGGEFWGQKKKGLKESSKPLVYSGGPTGVRTRVSGVRAFGKPYSAILLRI